MTIETPLPTLLSQALIAFTIEFDNEWEWRFVGGKQPKVFRTSMVMWSNFMRFVGDKGITVRQLSARAGYPKGETHPSLNGMTRWGYVNVVPNTQASAAKPPKLDWLVYPTTQGLHAAAVWGGLVEEIEQRWEGRFGNVEMANLRKALRTLINQFDMKLPHYFPVLSSRNGMRAVIPHEPDSDAPSDLALPALLSQVLHAFTLDFEQDTGLSLALRANVIRVLDENGVPVRNLPRLSGISKEAMAMATKFLQKTGHVAVVPDQNAPRGKVVRLTAKGQNAQNEYRPLLSAGEKLWVQKFGHGAVKDIHASLQPIVESKEGTPSPLFKGLKPHPSVWRAQIPKPDLLPHHPMVLHRGGWPDGS